MKPSSVTSASVLPSAYQAFSGGESGATNGPGAQERRDYEPGEVIFREGDPGDRAYIIQEGAVEVRIAGACNSVQLKQLGKGDIFGEISLFDLKPRTETVRALTPTRLIPVHRTQITELLDNANPILLHFLSLILERFRESWEMLQRQTERAAAQDAPAKKKQRGEVTQKLTLVHDIKHALVNDEFVLHYQPICEMATRRVAGFEALIRWNHPIDGFKLPKDFLWLTEHTGQIRDIGMWTLRRACLDWPRLRRATGGVQPFISINLSPNQLISDDFLDALRQVVEEFRIAPGEIKLELTETGIINNPDQAYKLLNQLSELGVRLALDDFGTGYSGLQSLHRYPIVTMKIDRAFVHTMIHSTQSREIVASSIRFAHSLGMDVVAEGIETEEVYKELCDLQCDFGQGALFGLPADIHAQTTAIGQD